MSAWYLFSALGFYPVTPGSPYYALGSPLVKTAVVHLENGHTLKVIAKNQSEENVYFEKVTWNGVEVKGFLLDHLDLVEGGELVFGWGGEKKIKKHLLRL